MSKKSKKPARTDTPPQPKTLNTFGVDTSCLRVGSHVKVIIFPDESTEVVEPITRPGIVTDWQYKGGLPHQLLFNHKKLRLQVLVDLGEQLNAAGASIVSYGHLTLRSKHVVADLGVLHLAEV